MKIGFYSPYLPQHFGGGEKHLFDIAQTCSHELGAQVFIALAQSPATSDEDFLQSVRQQYEHFLNYSLADLQFIACPLGTRQSWLKKLLWTAQFDQLFAVSDGSLFFSLARTNHLHIQIPFTQAKTGVIERTKFKNWQKKNANSQFTKRIVEHAWQTPIETVLYPLVETPGVDPTLPKEPIILGVGRFFRQLHSKRQDVLIELFKALVDGSPKESKAWKLVLIGQVEDAQYFAELQEQATGYPIELLTAIDRAALLNWYQRASIFWHAAGYGIDQTKEPEKVEHFGIATVEAMAAGCIPLVIGKGGQVEILGEKLKDLLWEKKAECLEKTLGIMTAQEDLTPFRLGLAKRAQVFGRDAFVSKIQSLFG